jgi:molybdopterin synthase catalytic subunit
MWESKKYSLSPPNLFPMPGRHFISSISEQRITDFEERLEPSSEHGADLRFHGVVRDSEEGKPITGIDYSCYPEMATRELDAIVSAMSEEFPEHRAAIHHTLGFVAVGKASILIRVQTAHSAEAFEISREYLRRIKTTVPIWKKPVIEE